MEMLRANQRRAKELRLAPSTVYDVGEARVKDYEARERIEEALRLGVQPVVPLPVSGKSQDLSF
jgi:hypothetical protein